MCESATFKITGIWNVVSQPVSKRALRKWLFSFEHFLSKAILEFRLQGPIKPVEPTLAGICEKVPRLKSLEFEI